MARHLRGWLTLVFALVACALSLKLLASPLHANTPIPGSPPCKLARTGAFLHPDGEEDEIKVTLNNELNPNIEITQRSSFATTYILKIEPHGVVRLLNPPEVQVSTYQNLEIDALIMGANASYAETSAEIEFEANVEMLSQDLEEGGLTPTFKADGRIRKCLLPRIILTVTKYPAATQSASVDIGPSIPLPFVGAIQGFLGYQTQRVVPGDAIKQQLVAVIDPLAVAERLAGQVPHMGKDPALQARMIQEINKIRSFAANGDKSVETYIGSSKAKDSNALSGIVMAAVTALDKVVAMNIASRHTLSLYYHHNNYSSFKTSPRQTELLIRGQALAEVSDHIMKTFICRFSPEVLDEVAKTWEARLVKRFRNNCRELRIAFENPSKVTRLDSAPALRKDFPYSAESVHGSAMLNLLFKPSPASLGLDAGATGNHGAAVFYLYAESLRTGVYVAPPDGSDINYDVNSSANVERIQTLRFIYDLATEPSIAKIGLKESGFLFPDEAERWQSGQNLDRKFLQTVLKRYDQTDHAVRFIHGGPELAWIRWHAPIVGGKQVIMQELAHRFPKASRLSSPYNFQDGKESAIDYTWPLEFLSHTEKVRIIGNKAEMKRLGSRKIAGAIRWCQAHGMALMGHSAVNGKRGYNFLVSAQRRLKMMPGGFRDPFGFWSKICSPVGMEVSDKRWSKAHLSTAELRDNFYPAGILSQDPIPRWVLLQRSWDEDQKQTDPEVGVICVSGTQASKIGRLPSWTEE